MRRRKIESKEGKKEGNARDVGRKILMLENERGGGDGGEGRGIREGWGNRVRHKVNIFFFF